MRYLLICLFLSLFAYTLGYAAVGDKKKVLMQEKFTSYSTNRAAQRVADMNTVVAKSAFTNHSTNYVICYKGVGVIGRCVATPTDGRCVCQ